MKAISSGVSRGLRERGRRLQDLDSPADRQALEDARCYAVFFNALANSRELHIEGDLIDRFSQVEPPWRA